MLSAFRHALLGHLRDKASLISKFSSFLSITFSMIVIVCVTILDFPLLEVLSISGLCCLESVLWLYKLLGSGVIAGVRPVFWNKASVRNCKDWGVCIARCENSVWNIFCLFR